MRNLSSFHVPSKKLKIRMCKTVILSYVLCGYETRSLALRKGHRLRMFRITLLGIILGPKRRSERHMERSKE
jgi:hypothetical protein